MVEIFFKDVKLIEVVSQMGYNPVPNGIQY